MKKIYVLSAIILSVSIGIAHAQETPFEGRSEVNTRYGTDRSILMTEFWVPFANRALTTSEISELDRQDTTSTVNTSGFLSATP